MKFAKSIIAGSLLACASATGSGAASTDWQELGGGKARMLARLDPASNEVSGVVEISLTPGWKTYWREPGGSGIPPKFDFSGSRHFLAGEIGYPVPEKMEAGGSVFAGYSGTVRFTFNGRINGKADESAIGLDLLAGICEEICIPATATFAIGYSQLVQSDPETVRGLEEAKKHLPGKPDREFGIANAVLRATHLEIEARIPAGAETPALFAEGPAGWYLVPALLVEAGGQAATFALDLSNIPSDADPATMKLRYTLVAGGRGVEQWYAPRHDMNSE